MWRAMLCTLTLKEKEFARPFYTFRPRSSKWIIQFDASLTGIGFLLIKRGPNTVETTVGAAGTSIESYGINKSDYQNTCEFIAALTGLCILVRLTIINKENLDSVEFRGDSEVALSWMDKLKSKSNLATKSCMMLTLIATRLDITVSGCEHVPAIDNQICDDLSRHYSVLESCPIGTHDLLKTIPNGNLIINELIQLCDPLIGVDEKEGDHESWWELANSFMTRLTQVN